MTKYNITYTDINKNPIELDEYAIDGDGSDGGWYANGGD
jgi:hypothetical protein